MIHSDILESLLRATHHLTRLAANETGNSTPAAAWRTLSILESDGPMRVGELATRSRITQPGMTRILASLVEDETVSRIADVDDSRAWLIVITPKGTKALAHWRHELARTLEPWFGDLDPADWATLARAAAVLDARVGADVAVAS